KVVNGITSTTFNADVILDGLTFTTAGDVTFGNAASDSLTISPVDAANVTIATGSAQVTIKSQTTLDQTLIVDTDNLASLISGVVQGIGGLTKEGTGRLTLSATDAYTGE